MYFNIRTIYLYLGIESLTGRDSIDADATVLFNLLWGNLIEKCCGEILEKWRSLNLKKGCFSASCFGFSCAENSTTLPTEQNKHIV